MSNPWHHTLPSPIYFLPASFKSLPLPIDDLLSLFLPPFSHPPLSSPSISLTPRRHHQVPLFLGPGHRQKTNPDLWAWAPRSSFGALLILLLLIVTVVKPASTYYINLLITFWSARYISVPHILFPLSLTESLDGKM